MINIPERYKDLKKIFVDTTHVATQIDSPKVYYRIKPEKGYVVCGYCNICFVLNENADLDTDKVFFYDENQIKLDEKTNLEREKRERVLDDF